MSKRKMRAYCLPCLLKFKKGDACPECGGPLKHNTNRIVSQVLARAKTMLGLRRKKGFSYAKYLKSPLWKRIRTRVLDRDGHRCAACGLVAGVVHHRSYERAVLMGRDDSGLVSLCGPCHEGIEFDLVNGTKVKNDLATANRKLDQRS